MKKTLAIAFNGGAYGTYLGWLLNVLVKNDHITSPFTNVGNSHNSRLEQHLLDIDGVLAYFDQDQEFETVRFHPKTEENHSLKHNLELSLNGFEKMILLYPDKDHEILCVNNYLTKVFTLDMYQGALQHVNANDIYNNFPIDRSIALKDIPRWIQREHASYWLFDSWRNQIEWYFPDHWNHPRCLIITVSELLHNVEATLEKIFYFWGKRPVRNIKDILPWHHDMLKLQQHLGQDRLCKDIVNSVINNTDPMTWQTLPLASEAWIQRQLREYSIDIQCHELDTFPQDTESLKKICA